MGGWRKQLLAFTVAGVAMGWFTPSASAAALPRIEPQATTKDRWCTLALLGKVAPGGSANPICVPMPQDLPPPVGPILDDLLDAVIYPPG